MLHSVGMVGVGVVEANAAVEGEELRVVNEHVMGDRFPPCCPSLLLHSPPPPPPGMTPSKRCVKYQLRSAVVDREQAFELFNAHPPVEDFPERGVT